MNDDTPGRWKMCLPDVFSIRNSSVQAYLEPIVHEIKVSRADLLEDSSTGPTKAAAYLDLGGQCWYVLGCDRSGHPIAKPNEIPLECGVMVYQGNQLEVMRMAPKRPAPELPFGVGMALAKATPMQMSRSTIARGRSCISLDSDFAVVATGVPKPLNLRLRKVP